MINNIPETSSVPQGLWISHPLISGEDGYPRIFWIQVWQDYWLVNKACVWQQPWCGPSPNDGLPYSFILLSDCSVQRWRQSFWLDFHLLFLILYKGDPGKRPASRGQLCWCPPPLSSVPCHCDTLSLCHPYLLPGKQYPSCQPRWPLLYCILAFAMPVAALALGLLAS